MDFIRQQVASFLVPLILGPATFYAMKYLKIASDFVGKQQPLVQQGIVIAISALLVAAGHLVPGQALACAAQSTCQISDITPDFVKALIGAGVAFLIHFKEQQVPAAAK